VSTINTGTLKDIALKVATSFAKRQHVFLVKFFNVPMFPKVLLALDVSREVFLLL